MNSHSAERLRPGHPLRPSIPTGRSLLGIDGDLMRTRYDDLGNFHRAPLAQFLWGTLNLCIRITAINTSCATAICTPKQATENLTTSPSPTKNTFPLPNPSTHPAQVPKHPSRFRGPSLASVTPYSPYSPAQPYALSSPPYSRPRQQHYSPDPPQRASPSGTQRAR